MSGRGGGSGGGGGKRKRGGPRKCHRGSDNDKDDSASSSTSTASTRASGGSNNAHAHATATATGASASKKRKRGQPPGSSTPAPYATYAALRAQGLVPVSALNACLDHDSLAGARALAGKDAMKALEMAQAALLQKGFLLIYVDESPRSVVIACFWGTQH
jgi:hypothetical protein